LLRPATAPAGGGGGKQGAGASAVAAGAPERVQLIEQSEVDTLTPLKPQQHAAGSPPQQQQQAQPTSDPRRPAATNQQPAATRQPPSPQQPQQPPPRQRQRRRHDPVDLSASYSGVTPEPPPSPSQPARYRATYPPTGAPIWTSTFAHARAAALVWDCVSLAVGGPGAATNFHPVDYSADEIRGAARLVRQVTPGAAMRHPVCG